MDFNRLLNAKITELDNKLRQLSISGRPASPGVGPSSSEGILSELTIKEAVDNMGMGLKNELL